MDYLMQPMTIAALLASGMGVALLGSLKLSLARRLGIDEARVGALVSAFGFTVIPMILISGFLTDHFGEQWVFIGGSFLMAAALFTLARARNYAGAFAAILLLGSAWSALVNAVNVIVPATFGGTMAYATNISNVFFGIGAFLTPVGLAALLRNREIPPVLYGISVAVLVPGLMAIAVDFSLLLPTGALGVPPEEVSDSVLLRLLSDPVLWLCSLGFFFYSPLEASMGAWSTTYLGERGLKEESALRWLSAFWLSFMLARLITAFSIPAGSEAGWILVLSLFAVATMASIVSSRRQRTAMANVVLAGFVFGPIFPTILAILLSHFPLEVRGRAVGLFFAIAAVGWTVIPALLGYYARRTSVQRAFLVAVASAFGLCAMALALVGRYSFSLLGAH